MRRVAWILAVFSVLCVSVGAAQAHEWYYHGHHGPYRAYCGPVVVRPPVVISPRLVVPVAPPSPVVCQPPYVYEYGAVPGGGFYYRGRGLSIGVGW